MSIFGEKAKLIQVDFSAFEQVKYRAESDVIKKVESDVIKKVIDELRDEVWQAWSWRDERVRITEQDGVVKIQVSNPNQEID